jgi:hypoxanthine phosphoribosyltransferase
MLDYTPEKCNWKKAVKLAEKMCKKIKAKKIINLRIARGGCYVARFLIDIKEINGIEQDICTEVKVYDNMPYLRIK